MSQAEQRGRAVATRRPRIGLVAYDSLGDGLMYLMVADNLRRNGFDVSYFGGAVSQLADWLPQFEVKPYPPVADMEAELDDFDLVICSPPSFIRHRYSEDQMRALAERYVLVCLSRHVPEHWRFDHRKGIRDRLPPDVADRLQGPAGCSGTIRYRRRSGRNMVEMALSFMTERMGLEDVSKDVELRPPDGVAYRRHRDRVVIFPDSANPERKDWTPARYLDLATRLTDRGLKPKIVVSADNLETWRQMPGNDYETTDFPSISALAAYLYESGVVIANDSGGGHLASFLGVPTITIYRRMKPSYLWRPGWGPGTVIWPTVTLSILKLHVWRPFISTTKILKAVDRYLSAEFDERRDR
jgi:hypothetical protein